MVGEVLTKVEYYNMGHVDDKITPARIYKVVVRNTVPFTDYVRISNIARRIFSIHFNYKIRSIRFFHFCFPLL